MPRCQRAHCVCSIRKDPGDKSFEMRCQRHEKLRFRLPVERSGVRSAPSHQRVSDLGLQAAEHLEECCVELHQPVTVVEVFEAVESETQL